MGNVSAITMGVLGAVIYSRCFLHHPKQYLGIFVMYSLSYNILFSNYSTLFSVTNIYIYRNGANPYAILTVQSLNGMCLFPFMGMIYEELISRLNPRYLLSVSVLLMMGT